MYTCTPMPLVDEMNTSLQRQVFICDNLQIRSQRPNIYQKNIFQCETGVQVDKYPRNLTLLVVFKSDFQLFEYRCTTLSCIALSAAVQLCCVVVQLVIKCTTTWADLHNDNLDPVIFYLLIIITIIIIVSIINR